VAVYQKYYDARCVPAEGPWAAAASASSAMIDRTNKQVLACSHTVLREAPHIALPARDPPAQAHAQRSRLLDVTLSTSQRVTLVGLSLYIGVMLE
jgi:hypothetical protein